MLFSVDVIDFMVDIQNVRCKYMKKGENHQTISVFFIGKKKAVDTKKVKAGKGYRQGECAPIRG